MSPTRSRYKELGLKIIDPLKDDPCQTQWPHMEEEMKDDGVGDPIKSLFGEALTRQRDEMLNNFAQINECLQQ